MLFPSPKGFLNGILMLLIFDANYIIIDQEIFTNPHKIILFRGRAFSQPEGLFEWDIDAFDIRYEFYIFIN